MNWNKAFKEYHMNYYRIIIPEGSSCDEMRLKIAEWLRSNLPAGKIKLYRSGDTLYIQSDAPGELNKFTKEFDFVVDDLVETKYLVLV